MVKHPVRRVVFEPAAHQGLQRGIQQLVAAIRPTLGPLPRLVACHQLATNSMPELLNKGGVIARRIFQLADRDADMGAMLARHMLWKLHEEMGDGTATAAVLLEAIYSRGATYVAAGGNAMRLRQHLERGIAVILEEMNNMTRPIEGKEQLTRLAHTLCCDAQLARMLGEIFDIIGAYGQLEIRPIRSRELLREYSEGMTWKANAFSREMFSDQVNLTALLEDAAILVSDLKIEEPSQLMPVLNAALQSGRRSLLIIASHLSPSAISILLANSRRQDGFRAIAVRTPGPEPEDEAAAIQDLAILTGARPFLEATGDRLERVCMGDLGSARRIWVDRARFGVVGGGGDPRRLRQHIATLRVQLANATQPTARRRLQQRVGQLMGGVATLRVGGPTEIEIETRKALAEDTASSMRAAIQDGVLPGGGAAYLACRAALQRRMKCVIDPDQRAAYRILTSALEAPARTIYANAGYNPSEVLARFSGDEPGVGFDVLSGRVVHMAEAGILDVAAVHKAALMGAVTTAALALSVEVLVHHRKPEEALNP